MGDLMKMAAFKMSLGEEIVFPVFLINIQVPGTVF